MEELERLQKEREEAIARGEEPPPVMANIMQDPETEEAVEEQDPAKKEAVEGPTAEAPAAEIPLGGEPPVVEPPPPGEVSADAGLEEEPEAKKPKTE